jgi:hypothetical protein
MDVRELMEKYPEEFKKIGAIFYSLNRIDIHLVTVLSSFFIDESQLDSEKNFILNDALWDDKIFPSMENRRMLMIKTIEDIARVAKEKAVVFRPDGFLSICASIGKVQKIRNKLAHQRLLFPGDGNVTYRVRKSPDERLQKISPGTLKEICINLDKELEFAETVIIEAQRLHSEFLPLARKIQKG